jgi:hypothetical protein
VGSEWEVREAHRIPTPAPIRRLGLAALIVETFRAWSGWGDAFAAGVIYGILSGIDAPRTVAFAAAGGLLVFAEGLWAVVSSSRLSALPRFRRASIRGTLTGVRACRALL